MAANAVNTVDFSNNYVNASDLKGAFVSWELVPNGPSVVPANSERSPPLLNATTLNAYKNDGNYESFKPESSVSFQVGEEVRLEGVDSDHKITLTGQKSLQRTVWALVARS